MIAWTSDELTSIGTAEELEIASLREDGTLRKSVTIWVVRLGDDLYVRPMYGRASVWFRATQVRHAGHIQAGGIHKDVTFVDEIRLRDQQPDRRRLPHQVPPLRSKRCRFRCESRVESRDAQTASALGILIVGADGVRPAVCPPSCVSAQPRFRRQPSSSREARVPRLPVPSFCGAMPVPEG